MRELGKDLALAREALEHLLALDARLEHLHRVAKRIAVVGLAIARGREHLGHTARRNELQHAERPVPRHARVVERAAHVRAELAQRALDRRVRIAARPIARGQSSAQPISCFRNSSPSFSSRYAVRSGTPARTATFAIGIPSTSRSVMISISRG